MFQESLRQNQFIQWIRTQFNFSAITKTLIIFGIFGYIPGAWLFGFPILFGYGLIKKSYVKNAFQKLAQENVIFKNNFSKEFGKKIADAFSDNPISVVRAVATFILLSSGLNLWNLVGIYGIYRFTNEEWAQSFSEKLESAYAFIVSVITRARERGTLDISVFILGVTSLLAAWSIATAGLLSMTTLGIVMLVIWPATISVGLSALSKDILYLLHNPIKVFTENAGKINGLWWGRMFAHKIFSGKLQGNLGHAQGFVQSGESLFFLFPENKFTFGISGIGLLFDKVRTFVNNFLSTFLLTSQVDVTGNFHGIVGPGPGTLFLFMSIGCLVGYGIEKLVDSLYQAAKEDTTYAKNKTIEKMTAIDHVYNAKWHALYIACFTPLILLSNGGATLIALAGGSVIKAAALTSGIMAGAFTAIYSLSYGARLVIERLRKKPSPPKNENLPVAVKGKENETLLSPSPAVPVGAAITHAYHLKGAEINKGSKEKDNVEQTQQNHGKKSLK